VDVYVNYLRKKLDDSAGWSVGGGLIQTVRGAGYRIGGPPRKRAAIIPARMPGVVAFA